MPFVAPVTSAQENDYALSDENYWQILDEFAALAEDYVAAAVENLANIVLDQEAPVRPHM